MRLRLHGLVLSVEGDARAVAVASDLLGSLDEDAVPGEADVRIVLRWTRAQGAPAGTFRLYHGPVRVHADEDDLLVWDGFSILRVRAGGGDIQAGVAEESLRDGQAFAQVVLFMALILALRWRQLFHLHAGALVTPDGRGVLVAGTAGAGKSTTTLALIEGGCSYLADDAVFLSGRQEGPAVVPFPRKFHVGRHTASAFRRLEPLLEGLLPGDEKRRLDPRLAWPGMGLRSMDMPAVLLLPHVSSAGETTVRPATSAEALGALIESAAYLVVDGLPHRAEHLDLLRRVADGVRTFHVSLGLDLLRDPAGTTARILRVI